MCASPHGMPLHRSQIHKDIRTVLGVKTSVDIGDLNVDGLGAASRQQSAARIAALEARVKRTLTLGAAALVRVCVRECMGEGGTSRVAACPLLGRAELQGKPRTGGAGAGTTTATPPTLAVEDGSAGEPSPSTSTAPPGSRKRARYSLESSSSCLGAGTPHSAGGRRDSADGESVFQLKGKVCTWVCPLMPRVLGLTVVVLVAPSSPQLHALQAELEEVSLMRQRDAEGHKLELQVRPRPVVPQAATRCACHKRCPSPALCLVPICGRLRRPRREKSRS